VDKNVKANIPIIGDAKVSLTQLLPYLKEKKQYRLASTF